MTNIFTNKKNLRDLRLIVVLMVMFLLISCCGVVGLMSREESIPTETAVPTNTPPLVITTALPMQPMRQQL